jgi:hypothetical protein
VENKVMAKKETPTGLRKGTKVSWLINPNMPSRRGQGTVLSEEDDGHVFVSVDTFEGEANPGYHPVIYCTVTWLTPVEEPTPS